MTPEQFARIARVDTAARMLRTEHAPLSAIASDAGYADQAHLSREFRALIGIAPGEYVRELGREHTSVVA